MNNNLREDEPGFAWFAFYCGEELIKAACGLFLPLRGFVAVLLVQNAGRIL